MKGGGDAVSAARAVMQTGEFDYAWNMQVEDEILKRFEQGGSGKADIVTGGNIEHIQLNNTDPWTEVDGERSSIKTKHPFLTDPAVRQALERPGRPRLGAGADLRAHRASPPPNFLNAPAPLRAPRTPSGSSTSTRPTRSWRRRAGRRARDGIRAKDGKKLKMVYQTSINAPAPEDPADREAGVRQGGHRHRDQVGHRVGLLLVRPGQPRTPTRTSPPTSRCTR